MNDYFALLKWPQAGWLLGLLLGLIIECIVQLVSPNATLGMFLVVSISFPIFGFLFKLPPASKMLKWFFLLLVLGVIYGAASACLMHLYMQEKNQFTGYPEILLIQLKFSAFIALAFYCTFVSSNGLRFSYRTLFHESWQLFQKSILGTLLMLLLFGLCLFAATLFNLLNLSEISTVVYHPHFKLIALPLFFGIAMSVLHRHEELLRKLRVLLLAFCRVLYPAFVLISLSFLIALFFSSIKFSDLWSTINMLAFFNVILINGVYQQGDWIERPYGRIFSLLINALIFILTAYLAYDLQFPTKALQTVDSASFVSGLATISPFRPGLLLLIFSTILFAYHLGYSFAVIFQRVTWLELLKRVNILLAVIIAVVYLGLVFLGCYQ